MFIMKDDSNYLTIVLINYYIIFCSRTPFRVTHDLIAYFGYSLLLLLHFWYLTIKTATTAVGFISNTYGRSICQKSLFQKTWITKITSRNFHPGAHFWVPSRWRQNLARATVVFTQCFSSLPWKSGVSTLTHHKNTF